jgi:hypothetical protein
MGGICCAMATLALNAMSIMNIAAKIFFIFM